MLRGSLAVGLVLAAVAGAEPALAAPAWPGNVSCETRGALGTQMQRGDNCRAFRFRGTARRYVAWVSRRAKRRMSRGRRVPVVVMLHGSTGTGERFLKSSGWKEKADAKGFIAVFPSSLSYVVDTEGPRRNSTRWAAYELEDEIDETVVAPANDVGFLRRVMTDVFAVNRVARRKVFLSGFSNGGSMCMRAALELTRVFRAFGCNAGTVGDEQATVTPGAPFRPVLFAYGNRDRNLLAAAQSFDPSLTEVPMDPSDAFANDAVRGLAAQQLATLRLGPQPDVLIRRPAIFDLRFDEPVSQAQSSQLQFVLLDEVEHEYPRKTNNPNRFNMPDLLWRFFNG